MTNKNTRNKDREILKIDKSSHLKSITPVRMEQCLDQQKNNGLL